ncbi:P-loop containing nucleoside triphosphate hydrolase protein, partial [Blastocladiella britannica]
SAIAAGGKNLSVGQRQLLALARALVRRSKVIIMDESTANVSHDLDAKIQVTVREEFKDSTILVIAHRLRTVCDFDKILVLDHGQVVEFGSPFELISRDQGTFRHMCSESGEFDHLLAMARR